MAYTLRRGQVTHLSLEGVYCEIPSLGPQQQFGPMEMVPWPVETGDNVLVGQVDGAQEELVLIAPLVNSHTLPATNGIYFFETQAERDTVLGPTPSSGTAAWVDDDIMLYVYSDEAPAGWREVGWDETRVANLEAFGVSDTATVDLTLTGTTVKTLSAVVKPDSIPLNDLSDVGILLASTGDLIRFNGLTWSNSRASLDELSDVAITTPLATQTLRHNGTEWVNTLLLLDDLNGVVISAPAVGQTLRYNGGSFVNTYLSLDDLSDAVLSGVASGDFLFFNGTNWINTPLLPKLLNSSGVNAAAVTSGTNSTSSTTYVDLAGTGSVTSFSFTKKYSDTLTKLKIDMRGGYYVNNTDTRGTFGVNISGTGGGDFDVFQTQSAGVSAHMVGSGITYVLGLPVGTKTVQGRWKRHTGTGTLNRGVDDWLTIDCEEVPL